MILAWQEWALVSIPSDDRDFQVRRKRGYSSDFIKTADIWELCVIISGRWLCEHAHKMLWKRCLRPLSRRGPRSYSLLVIKLVSAKSGTLETVWSQTDILVQRALSTVVGGTNFRLHDFCGSWRGVSSLLDLRCVQDPIGALITCGRASYWVLRSLLDIFNLRS